MREVVSERHWSEVLEFSNPAIATPELVELRFKTLARIRHPDAGGSQDEMVELSLARERALEELSR